jgi:hypothetical protein
VTKTPASHLSTKRELDAVPIAKHIDSLRNELSKPIGVQDLDKWVAHDSVRKNILSGSVWGTIQWPKSFGRPIAPTSPDAFDIEHVHWEKKLDLLKKTYVEILAPHSSPSKWDAAEDSEYYRVGFMSYAARGFPNRISVSFAAHAGWEGRIQIVRSYREIVPPERYFDGGQDRPVVLEPFNVLNTPF